MTDKTLGNARGLNSIADPRAFKGSAGRAKLTRPVHQAPEPEPVVEHDRQPAPAEERVRDATVQPIRPISDSAPDSAPHRAVAPGVQRKRRELSVPHQIADAVDRTGINAADIVMAGYRKHSDSIYAGAGGRMAARGRRRLRLSISDTEFDQLTRLGRARGWNRSETVSVILALELMPEAASLPSADD